MQKIFLTSCIVIVSVVTIGFSQTKQISQSDNGVSFQTKSNDSAITEVTASAIITLDTIPAEKEIRYDSSNFSIVTTTDGKEYLLHRT